MTNEMMVADKIHKFEAAGLGKAPFRYVGHTREIFQAIPGDSSCPIQPGTSCDYCGMAICDAYHIVSADGRRFKVGCDCVAKTGDAGLRKVTTVAQKLKNERARERRAVKAKERQADLDAMLAREDVRARLAAEKHPRGFISRETGVAMTKLDWAEWMAQNAGDKGRAEVLKAIAA